MNLHLYMLAPAHALKASLLAALLGNSLMTRFTSVAGFFVSLFCETSLHGMYTVTLAACIYLIHQRRKAEGYAVSALIQVAIGIMYSISTTHLVLALVQDLRIFVFHPTTVNDNTEKIGNPYIVAQLGLEFTNCLLADSVIIWRAWVLWQKRTVVVAVPIALLLATGVSGFIFLYRISKIDSPGSVFVDVFDNSVATWTTAFAALTLTTNILSTALIAYRIWSHHRQLKHLFNTSPIHSRYREIFIIVVESGAIYSTAWALTIALNLIGSVGIIVMVDIIAQLTGIVPTLIVVLIASKSDSESHRTRTLSTLNPPSSLTTSTQRSRLGNGRTAVVQIDIDMEMDPMDSLPKRLKADSSSRLS